MVKKTSEHGCVKGKFLVPIEEALKEGELTGKELFTKAKSISPEAASLKFPNKSFVQAIHCLLKDKRIQIEGFASELDERKDSKHSLIHEYLIYSLVKSNPVNIRHLINNLDSKDQEILSNTYHKLKKLFKEGIKKIESENATNWELLKNNVLVRDPRTEDLLFLEGEKEEDAFLLAQESMVISKIESEDADSLIRKANEYKKEMDELIEKYSDYSVYILMVQVNKRSLPYPIEWILEILTSKNEVENLSFKDPCKCYNDLYYPRSISKDCNKDKYLEKEFRLNRTMKMSNHEISNLFEDLLSHIHSDELKLKLARGLSNQNRSYKILDDLISETTKNGLISDYERYISFHRSDDRFM